MNLNLVNNLIFSKNKTYPLLLFIPVRFNRQFVGSMLKQQMRLMDKFDREVQNTMEKIRTNQKIKIKRKKALLTETTNILMDKQLVNNKTSAIESNFSTGSPEQLVIRQQGMTKSFLSTRMKILNTNYLRSVMEIFVSDEEYSKKIDEYKFRITDVRVSVDYSFLQIYWMTENQNDSHKEMVASYLNNNKGRFYELLCDSQYGRKVPWILFIYDLQTSYEQELQNRLCKCAKDLETTNEKCPEAIKNIQTEDFQLKDQINFDGTIKLEIEDLENSLERLKYKTNPIQYEKLGMPQDMFMKSSELDYESLYIKVLKNMHRTREEHKQDMAHLKSLEQLSSKEIPQDNKDLNTNRSQQEVIDYDTENRIKAIKKFVWINRKRKDKLERKLKRMILSEEIDRFNDYEQLKEFVEEKYSNVFSDQSDECGTIHAGFSENNEFDYHSISEDKSENR